MFDVLCVWQHPWHKPLITEENTFIPPFSLVKFFRWLLGKEGVSRGK